MIAPRMDPAYSAVCIAALSLKQMAVMILSAAVLVRVVSTGFVGTRECRIDR